MLCWLAIMREPGTLDELLALLVLPLPRRQVLLEAIDSLRALRHVDIADREEFYLTLRTIFLADPSRRPEFDEHADRAEHTDRAEHDGTAGGRRYHDECYACPVGSLFMSMDTASPDMMEHLLAGMQYVLGDLKADDSPSKKKSTQH